MASLSTPLHRHPRTRAARTWGWIEPLEARIAPAATAILNPVSKTLRIVGDGSVDHVVLQQDPADATKILVVENEGTPLILFHGLKSSYRGIQVMDGAGGSMALTLDLGNGDPVGGKTFAFNANGTAADHFTLAHSAADAAWLPGASASNSGSVGLSTTPADSLSYANVGGGLTFDTFHSLTLTTAAGADTFALDAASGSATTGSLAGTGGSGGRIAHSAAFTHVSALAIDLGSGDGTNGQLDQLTVNKLVGAGLSTVAVKAVHGYDTLILGSGLTSLATPAGGSFTFDGGTGTSTVQANAATPMKLTSSALTYGDNSALSYQRVETFWLYGNSLSYAGSDRETVVWTPGAAGPRTGSLAIAGTSAPTSVFFAGPLDVQHVAALKLLAPGGGDVFTLGYAPAGNNGTLAGTILGSTGAVYTATFSGVPALTLSLGSSTGVVHLSDVVTITSLQAPGLKAVDVITGSDNDTLHLDGLTSLALPGAGVSFEGGGADDTVTATGSMTFGLTHTALIFGDGSTLAYTSAEQFTLAGNGFQYTGSGAESAVWYPTAAAPETDTLGIYGSTTPLGVRFTGHLSVRQVSSFTLRTELGSDNYTLSGNGAVSLLASTTHVATFSGVPSLTVDLGSSGFVTEYDTLTVTSLPTAGSLASVKFLDRGSTGTLVLSDLTSLALPGSGGGFSFDDGDGLGNGVLKVTTPSALALGEASLTYPDGSSVTFSGIEPLSLTAAGLSFTGDDTDRVGWAPSAGPGDSGVLSIGPNVASPKIVTYVLSNNAAPLALAHLAQLTLFTPDGADHIELGAASAAGLGAISSTVAGSVAQTATYTHVASLILRVNPSTLLVNSVTVNAFAGAGLANLSIDLGLGPDSVTFASTVKSLTLPAAGGGITVVGGASGTALDAFPGAGVALTLGDSTLTYSTGGSLSYTNVSGFGLTADQLTYDGADAIAGPGTGQKAVRWYPDATNSGQGSLSLGAIFGNVTTITKSVAYTAPQLAFINLASLEVITPAGPDAFTLSGTGTVGTDSVALLAGSVNGGTTQAGTYTRVAKVVLDFGANDGTALTADALVVSQIAGEGLQTLAIDMGAGDNHLTLLSGVTTLVLPGNHPGTAQAVQTGLSFNASTAANSGNSRLDVTADASMTLADGSLKFEDNTSSAVDDSSVHSTVPGGLLGQLSLTGGGNLLATLTGGASGNRFIVNGWSHDGLTINGGNGTNLYMAQNWSGANGVINGGSGNDTLDLSPESAAAPTNDGARLAGWKAMGTFHGGPGTDTVKATANVDFLLADDHLARHAPAVVDVVGHHKVVHAAASVTTTITEVENGVLTGGFRANTLNALAFSGTTTLEGRGGRDNLLAGAGSATLYGYYAVTPSAATVRSFPRTADNFFVSNGTVDATDQIHPTTVGGNLLSFRYYQSTNDGETGVKYTIPNYTQAATQVSYGTSAPILQVAIVDPTGHGYIQNVEGSSFNDTLIGNARFNVIKGGLTVRDSSNHGDILRSVGEDLLVGVVGDLFGGPTPYRYTNLNGVQFKGTTGLPAPYTPPAHHRTALADSILRIAELIG